MGEIGEDGTHEFCQSKEGVSGVGTSEMLYFPPVGGRQDVAVHVSVLPEAASSLLSWPLSTCFLTLAQATEKGGSELRR